MYGHPTYFKPLTERRAPSKKRNRLAQKHKAAKFRELLAQSIAVAHERLGKLGEGNSLGKFTEKLRLGK